MNWPFRRKQNQASVPLEVQEYYQTERRERTGVAWLLAIGTLIVTVLLALVLFYGGRWAYRAITNDNDTATEGNNAAQVDDSAATTSTPSGSSNEPANTGTSSTNTDQTSSQNTANAPTSTATDSAAVAGTSTAPTTTNASDLPNTGPGDVIAISAMIVFASTLAYYVVTRKHYQA